MNTISVRLSGSQLTEALRDYLMKHQLAPLGRYSVTVLVEQVTSTELAAEVVLTPKEARSG